MTRYEYKVVAAPNKTKSFKGVRSHEDLFASVLAEVMNDMANSQWEYLRAESLPCEERSGLTGRVEAYQSVLVFRRAIIADQKFFEAPPTRQIELHQVQEDRTEQEVVFKSGNVTAINPDMTESEEPATQSGVLGILRSRKARLVRDDTEEPIRLAGE
ncbi:MAG: hypothetical protein ACI861_001712 [Paracoccaceae bacterium]|jgi:hypothetical protein